MLAALVAMRSLQKPQVLLLLSQGQENAPRSAAPVLAVDAQQQQHPPLPPPMALPAQVLGGALADRVGGKSVLAVGVTAWSITTALTPGAAALGVPALLAMRVAMGLGEGVAFPAIHSIIASAVPVERQSTAVALVTASSYAGTALAFGLAPTLIDKLGWQVGSPRGVGMGRCVGSQPGSSGCGHVG